MPHLYIIAGPNGAGKTTAAVTILPTILNCMEFVNADNIAVGLSPFNPSGVAFEAGRLMLLRIEQLLQNRQTFAFETTLATKSYVTLIKKAQDFGYKVTIAFFWLPSPEMAIERVKQRVLEGGHHVPDEVVRRRYRRGLENFFKLFISICNHWLLIDNSALKPKMIAFGANGKITEINNQDLWFKILNDNQKNE
ncbi:MAG: zeta toxin family protein [Runella sp.]